MKRIVCILLLACLWAGASFVPALAQKRITNSDLQELAHKTKAQHEAYLRMEQAEKEALEEGSANMAAQYRKLKEKAQHSYNQLSTQLQQVQATKREQDKREQTEAANKESK